MRSCLLRGLLVQMVQGIAWGFPPSTQGLWSQKGDSVHPAFHHWAVAEARAGKPAHSERDRSSWLHMSQMPPLCSSMPERPVATQRFGQARGCNARRQGSLPAGWRAARQGVSWEGLGGVVWVVSVCSSFFWTSWFSYDIFCITLLLSNRDRVTTSLD